MKSAVRFKQTVVPKQQGELARFKVVSGPDQGSVFVILGNKATIGRGEECDILIADLKASRVHGEIRLSKDGWILTDSKSVNGILYNGKATRQALMKLKDVISLGETTLEFTTADAGTQMLVAPPRTLQQVQNDISSGLTGITPSPSSSPAGSRKNILIGVVVMAAAFLLFGGDDKPKKKKQSSTKSAEKSSDLSAFLPKQESSRAADTLFKDGMREYFSGNYTRAKSQFETVLQIIPGHNLAKIYLENCNKSLESSVKLHLEHGKKSLQAGKLREAKGHFERVMRLLYRDQTNPSHLEAKDQYEKVLKEMSGGETN
jgi:pSer/pThr/pTyr-binding forkhead associated (FHA) protein